MYRFGHSLRLIPATGPIIDRRMRPIDIFFPPILALSRNFNLILDTRTPDSRAYLDVDWGAGFMGDYLVRLQLDSWGILGEEVTKRTESVRVR